MMKRVLTVVGLLLAFELGIVYAKPVSAQSHKCIWQAQWFKGTHPEDVQTLLNSLQPDQARDAKIVPIPYADGNRADYQVWICVP